MLQLDFLDIIKYWVFFMITLSIHQYGHVKVAIKMGQNQYEQTPLNSINPFVHISVLSIFTGLFLGVMWPKKISYMPKADSNMPIKRQRIIFGVAGVAANLIAGVAILLVIFLLVTIAKRFMDHSVYSFFRYDMMDLGLFNLYFALVNCVPIKGLDGYTFIRFVCTRLHVSKKIRRIYNIVTYTIIAGVIVFGITRYDLYVYDCFLKIRELLSPLY